MSVLNLDMILGILRTHGKPISRKEIQDLLPSDVKNASQLHKTLSDLRDQGLLWCGETDVNGAYGKKSFLWSHVERSGFVTGVNPKDLREIERLKLDDTSRVSQVPGLEVPSSVTKSIHEEEQLQVAFDTSRPMDYNATPKIPGMETRWAADFTLGRMSVNNVPKYQGIGFDFVRPGEVQGTNYEGRPITDRVVRPNDSVLMKRPVKYADAHHNRMRKENERRIGLIKRGWAFRERARPDEQGAIEQFGAFETVDIRRTGNNG